MDPYLSTSIEYLKGIGPARAKLLKSELQIRTFEDLLLHFPLRYMDRSKVTKIVELNGNENYVMLKGRLNNIVVTQSGHTVRMNALFSDDSGTVELAWFQGVRWLKESLKANEMYILTGKPSLFNGHYSITHPELEPLSRYQEGEQHPFMPLYSCPEKLKAKGITSKVLAKAIDSLLQHSYGKIPENMPVATLEKYHLPRRDTAFRQVHFPANHHDIALGLQRFKYEELFFLQFDYQYAKHERQHNSKGLYFGVVGEHFNRFYQEKLPFELTGAQKRVIKEIRADMRSGHQMNRLLQGDVGSGKTLVALLCMLIALDNQCQACLMAPTEILAQQHYSTITRMLDGLDIKVELLTGSLKASAKKKLKQRLESGDIDILIGTHALIEDSVQFRSLGFVVIDEQHRFGVEQRSKLWEKNSVPPHVLVMTATPIPRTLAMTLYGDLDCSIIDELPPGRQPIKTIHCTENQRLRTLSFLREQIAAGWQVYIVYPLIDESEKSDLQSLMEGFEMITRHFPLPDYHVGMLHGRMSPADKELAMEHFKKGIDQILVSTTVIEVGVDVPNATVMMIENAERFGLSQLHQLRGRVGRGANQSYCILMTKQELGATARERIQTMVSSNDGFRLAEVDLKLRGPGDLQGLQQSGILNLRVADIVNDEAIVRAARDTVKELLEQDPQLQHPANTPLRNYLKKKSNQPRWEKIS